MVEMKNLVKENKLSTMDKFVLQHRNNKKTATLTEFQEIHMSSWDTEDTLSCCVVGCNIEYKLTDEEFEEMEFEDNPDNYK